MGVPVSRRIVEDNEKKKLLDLDDIRGTGIRKHLSQILAASFVFEIPTVGVPAAP
jgi:hypothetical protein